MATFRLIYRSIDGSNYYRTQANRWASGVRWPALALTWTNEKAAQEYLRRFLETAITPPDARPWSDVVKIEEVFE